MPTITKNEPGWRNVDVVDKNGDSPSSANERWYCKNTGRLVQKGLQQVISKGFLLTPTVTQINRTTEGIQKRKEYRESIGRQYVPGCLEEQIHQLIPTPREAMSRGNCFKDRGKGNIEDWVAKMIPTPQTQGLKVCENNKSRSITSDELSKLLHTPTSGLEKHSYGDNSSDYYDNRIKKGRQTDIALAVYKSEGSGQLNPDWVEWLMGFPVGWTNPDVSREDLRTYPIHTEPDIPRVRQGIPYRSQRLKQMGNAIVPDVIYQIYNAIDQL